jgi:hypothetical protein
VNDIAPKVNELGGMLTKVDGIKHLDKCRRIVAQNTLKQWGKKMRDTSDRRMELLDGRYSNLNEEEEKTNDLLLEYYSKMKQLQE